jgi:hypothetical protein
MERGGHKNKHLNNPRLKNMHHHKNLDYITSKNRKCRNAISDSILCLQMSFSFQHRYSAHRTTSLSLHKRHAIHVIVPPTPRHLKLSQSVDHFFISVCLSCVTSRLHRVPTSERAAAVAAGHFTVVCTWLRLTLYNS